MSQNEGPLLSPRRAGAQFWVARSFRKHKLSRSETRSGCALGAKSARSALSVHKIPLILFAFVVSRAFPCRLPLTCLEKDLFVPEKVKVHGGTAILIPPPTLPPSRSTEDRERGSRLSRPIHRHSEIAANSIGETPRLGVSLAIRSCAVRFDQPLRAARRHVWAVACGSLGHLCQRAHRRDRRWRHRHPRYRKVSAATSGGRISTRRR